MQHVAARNNTLDLMAQSYESDGEPDEKEGRFLLNEILLSGNFGQADQRYRYKRLFKLQRMLSRGSHLLIHYPSEVIWSPIWIVYHWFWKRKKKREIHKLWQFGS